MSARKDSNRTYRKITLSAVAIVILTICLCVTTYALVMVSVSINDNIFSTGSVGINLNDGEAVIKEGDFMFEPGMTVKSDFFVKNTGSGDAWVNIYFVNVDGGLKDVLQVKIYDRDNGDPENPLWMGTPAELNRAAVIEQNNPFKLMADADNSYNKRWFTIEFYYPSESGNETQKAYLEFDLVAEAVQTKNNETEKAFPRDGKPGAYERSRDHSRTLNQYTSTINVNDQRKG